jgi:nucleotide-binding universal stress UspA family protein
MFKHILVPLDGSHFAEAAVPYAVELARSANARLTLVLAHEPALALAGMGEAPPPIELEQQVREQESQYLSETAGMLVASGYPLTRFEELDGAAGPELAEAATRIGADLVVMATHGRGAIGRLWFGSVADYLVRHLTIPVLLVHPAREPTRAGPPALRSILVALDLSDAALAALEPVVAMAQLTQGHVTLVHVMEPLFRMEAPGFPFPVPLDPAFLEQSEAQAQKRLDEVADGLRDRGISVCSRVVTSTGPAAGLLDVLAGERFDLIALTTHGAGGVKRLLLGSVADKVIRGTEKPVLVVRPNGTGQTPNG